MKERLDFDEDKKREIHHYSPKERTKIEYFKFCKFDIHGQNNHFSAESG